MAKRSPVRTITTAALCVVVIRTVAAQASPPHLDLYRPAIDSNGMISLDSPQILGPALLSLGLNLSHALRPLVLTGDRISGHQFVVRHWASGQLSTAVGVAALTPSPSGLALGVEVGVSLPFRVWQAERTAHTADPAAASATSAQGIGDVALHLKTRILSSHAAPFGLGLLASLTLPTASADFLGEGSTGVALRLLLDRALARDRLTIALNLGPRLRAAGTEQWRDNVVCGATGVSPPSECGTGQTLVSAHTLTYGAGLRAWIVRQRFELLLELVGHTRLSAPFSSRASTAVELLGGLRWYLATNSYLMLGVGRGLRDEAANFTHGSPSLRTLLAFVFEPAVADRDGDGLKDDVDRCPADPEDHDDFEDRDGCPDADNDRDGLVDRLDRCPNTPEDKDGQDDADGCPEADLLDRDGDGLADTQDRCPDDPEDIDGFRDADGCPDLDNDEDAILDIDDLCPLEAEDRDGFEDRNGCPDPDNDRDRIADLVDRCPMEPENYNGVRDRDGCPDPDPRPLADGKIQVMEPIYFETNRTVIRPLSYPTLDAVVATLEAHPSLVRIEIAAHADERASHQHNLTLTQRRAQAVRRYLVSKGISPNRLRAKGYGETRPLDKRHTPAAWAKNRRVEFVVIERARAEYR